MRTIFKLPASYLRYVPNVNHSLAGSDAADSVLQPPDEPHPPV
jgi:hypothetical protein